MQACMHARTHSLHTCTRMHACTHTHALMQVCTHTYMCTHTHTHTHTHTQTHTHTVAMQFEYIIAVFCLYICLLCILFRTLLLLIFTWLPVVCFTVYRWVEGAECVCGPGLHLGGRGTHVNSTCQLFPCCRHWLRSAHLHRRGPGLATVAEAMQAGVCQCCCWSKSSPKIGMHWYVYFENTEDPLWKTRLKVSSGL